MLSVPSDREKLLNATCKILIYSLGKKRYCLIFLISKVLLLRFSSGIFLEDASLREQWSLYLTLALGYKIQFKK